MAQCRTLANAAVFACANRADVELTRRRAAPGSRDSPSVLCLTDKNSSDRKFAEFSH